MLDDLTRIRLIGASVHARDQLGTDAFRDGQGRREEHGDFGIGRTGVEHPNDGKGEKLCFVGANTVIVHERSNNRVSPPSRFSFFRGTCARDEIGPAFCRQAFFRLNRPWRRWGQIGERRGTKRAGAIRTFPIGEEGPFATGGARDRSVPFHSSSLTGFVLGVSRLRNRVLLRGMIIDAAGERSEQGRFLSKSPSGNAVSGVPRVHSRPGPLPARRSSTSASPKFNSIKPSE